MCMPLLGKLFGRSHRRRNEIECDTPPPSLATTPLETSAISIVVERVQEEDDFLKAAEVHFTPGAATGNVDVVGPSTSEEAAVSWWQYLGLSRGKKVTIVDQS